MSRAIVTGGGMSFMRRFGVPAAIVGIVVTLVAPVAVAAPALPSAATPTPSATTTRTCRPPAPGRPMFITDDCVDPFFGEGVIDTIEERTTPVPHRYVNGHFAGTTTRFSFYFPPPEQYEGRFFQRTHQLITSENLDPSAVAFAIASGGYAVQSNMGGDDAARSVDDIYVDGKDPSIVGYRANAAAARFSRVVANEIYAESHGPHRPFGYLAGASGGAYQTVSSLENTTVWDGGVPHVMGSPNAIPGVFTARIHALRVLRQRDRFPCIVDAIDPGGSGDPVGSCDLNDEEQGALEEATRLGIPPRAWFQHESLTGGPLRLVAGYVPALDAGYFDDYWDEPGYLGHDDPYGTVAAARIQHPTTVTSAVSTGDAWIVAVEGLPAGDIQGADIVTSGGEHLSILQRAGPSTVVALGDGSDLSAGDPVTIDNSDHLALQTYHRHQVPPRGMIGWDQFRTPTGTLYPQRDELVGPIGAFNGAGSHQTGQFHGKMIQVQNMMDIDALPSQSHWYRTRVQAALGSRYRDNFRIWFTDHAPHTGVPSGAAAARMVGYGGVIEQAFRDVAAWVEQGVAPPAETRYELDEAQVVLPDSAAVRRGVQPVVDLRADGAELAEVEVGEAVTFRAKVQVPPGAGEVVGLEWDFLGTGAYVPAELGRPGTSATVTIRATHTFTEPGTYFPVLRATSHRDGDPGSLFARIQNIDRVRVVVDG